MIFALSLLVPSVGLAQELPFPDFKGLALGSDIAAVKNSPKFSCKDPQSPIADEICDIKFGERKMITGAPVDLLGLYYYLGRLETIAVSFDPKYFSQVVDALGEIYGKGSLDTELLWKDQPAASWSRSYSWRVQNATLTVREYVVQGRLSTMTYSTDFHAKELARRKDALPTPTAASQPDAEIRAFCAKQWPTDFVMQAHCVEQQRKAAEALQGVLNVPTNVSTIIRQKCTADWPE